MHASNRPAGGVLVNAARLAVGTLTILPAGAVTRVDRRVAGTAMVLAPLAVIPLALVAAGSGWLAHRAGFPALLGGLLAVAMLAAGTRALHLDGLADTVDGLGSGWDRDKALSVLRRGDVGPMGVTALVLVLGAQAVAMGRLVTSWPAAVTLAVLICLSRTALTMACRQGVRPARRDGLGAGVAGTVPRWAVGATWLLAATVLSLLAMWRQDPWWFGLVAAAVVVLAVALLVRRCVRRFGGVTGDVMGASVEVALTVLVVLAAR